MGSNTTKKIGNIENEDARRELQGLQQKIDALLDSGGELPSQELLCRVAQEVDFSEELMREIAVFDEDYYTRNLLHDHPLYQVLVLCWKPNQFSPIHNHKGSNCVVRVLKGRAAEVNMVRGAGGRLFPSLTTFINQGCVTASSDDDMHQMGNLENEDLITLHIYSPPLKKMELFDIEDSVCAGYQKLLELSLSVQTRRCTA